MDSTDAGCALLKFLGIPPIKAVFAKARSKNGPFNRNFGVRLGLGCF